MSCPSAASAEKDSDRWEDWVESMPATDDRLLSETGLSAANRRLLCL